MAFDPISIGLSVGESIFDRVFNNIDQGHWEGNRFIPGDIDSRQTFVGEQLRSRGLLISDVDYNQLYDILTTPGIWQGQVTGYLDQVAEDKKLGKGKFAPITNYPVTTVNEVPQNPEPIKAGFNLGGIEIFLMVGALIYFLFNGTGGK